VRHCNLLLTQVLEENTIVAEVTFSENASGTAVLQGQFISADKGKASVPQFGYFKRFAKTESREMTIANARRKLQNVAVAVRLSEHHVEMAHRWFILAIQHSFTRGRRSQNIVAACLYIVCRYERTPHMLLDFSEVLHVNVYSLGNTFLRLVKLLNLDLPLVDPSLYIGRFAARLDFKEKTQIVASTALRLVSRMKRDWIVTGRRPTGICGACLLISARMHNFERSI
jgi:transcription factor IIIB subunit 2